MGLAAAYEAAVVSKAEVVLYEKDAAPGGLARTFEIGGEQWERYHHFISGNDEHLLDMARLLGISSEISWRETKLGYFTGGRVVPFTTAGDLLRFPGLSLIDKIRFGLSMMALTRRTLWDALENISARDWLIRTQGRRAYDKIWAHLMEMKFGDEVGVIPLSWFWSRSRRRASNRRLLGDVERFGAFNKSAARMAEAFIGEIKRAGGEFRNSTAALKIEKGPGGGIVVDSSIGAGTFDRVIVTTPLPVFIAMAPSLPADYVKALLSIKYAAIINMVVALEKPLTPYFWLNISDRDMPFPGVIEMTHLRPAAGGMSLIYIPNYVYSEHDDLKRTDEELFKRYLPALERIHPGLKIREYRVFRDKYADPYYSLNYSRIMPPPRTPIEGVFLANTAQVYPVTRSLNNSIEWGRRIARVAAENPG